MIFDSNLPGNNRSTVSQWVEVNAARRMAAANEAMHTLTMRRAGVTVVNEGLIPRDVYQDFDNVTVEVMHSDDGDAYLNDLLALSSSVSIGKLVQKFRKASDAGNAQTSMTGQIGIKMDQVEYSYDGAIIPIHDTAYTRNWREWNAMTSEGFDALIDDQRESVRSLRQHIADQFMDGHVDAQGNPIVVDSLSWLGMRNDSRVESIDLGSGGVNFDFTDSAQTGEAIKAALIEVRDIMRITNLCSNDITFYISREIGSNWERRFSQQYAADLIYEELAKLVGIATIKQTSKLTGNQLMGFPLDRNRIRALVGMGINTVAMPRPLYNSNYEFAVWGAVGFQVRTDFNGNTCAFYAAA
jgi:hypothetical protein